MKKRLPFTLIGAASLLLVAGLGISQWLPVTDSNAASLPKELPQPVFQAQTLPAWDFPNHATRFIALGDPGSGAKQEYDMAAQMLAYYQKKPYEAALVLGDNIYPDGDVDKFGEERFNKPFRPIREGKKVQFIITLGNHDLVRGDVDKQLKFYDMPDRYYKKSIGKAKLVDVFVIDSNIYAGDKKQIEWLDKELGNSKAQWKVVMGHHPIYSSGLHGNHGGLQKTLEPLLVKHHVPLYIAGHDHQYERFEPIQGVTYVISGGAGAYLRKFGITKAHSVKRLSAFNFVGLEATPKDLRMEAINREGQVFDSVTIASKHAH